MRLLVLSILFFALLSLYSVTSVDSPGTSVASFVQDTPTDRKGVRRFQSDHVIDRGLLALQVTRKRTGDGEFGLEAMAFRGPY
jgi:hypothetical protein